MEKLPEPVLEFAWPEAKGLEGGERRFARIDLDSARMEIGWIDVDRDERSIEFAFKKDGVVPTSGACVLDELSTIVNGLGGWDAVRCVLDALFEVADRTYAQRRSLSEWRSLQRSRQMVTSGKLNTQKKPKRTG